MARKKTTVSLQKPTPEWMSKGANGIIFLVTAWAIFSPSITELSDLTKADITRWSAIISGLLKLASKFFGTELVHPDTDKP